MFYYIEGTVAEILPNLAVIDCCGVGYACKTTNHTLSALQKGQKGKLYTWLNAGDGIFDLYGFAAQNELNSFKHLISVSGVGPRAALGILSTITPENLALAVVTEDTKALTAAPGVGKKIAQRIILELKDKLSRELPEDTSGLLGAALTDPGSSASKTTEAAQALVVLGYTMQEAAVALKGIDSINLPLEEIIRQALKKMLK